MQSASLLAAVLVATTPAAGADEATTRGLLACRAIASAEARLACFDRQASAVAAAIAADRVRVVDTAELKRAQAARFGLPGGAAGADGRLSHIETRLVSAASLADGRALLVLGDGSRWRQVDDYPLTRPPRPGDPVTVDLTSLGSYKLRVGKEAPIRVRRADRP